MDKSETTFTMRWGLRLGVAVLLVPALLWIAGCDSNGGMNEEEQEETGLEYANYDTTESGTVEVTDNKSRELGIGYVNAEGDTVNKVTWTNDHTYILTDRIFINDGQELTIEPGTVVKGRFRSDPTNASVLIAAQGGKLIADGEPDNPIIFTAEDDNVGEFNLPPSTRQTWGGIILLGNAPTNTTPGVIPIEGIPAEEDPRSVFGCGTDGIECDPNNNSGTLRYVSIRYGGISIGSGNEINGLTLGGVGRGTTIEYVEIFNNLDDGLEWFGGTANVSHIVSAFNGDDSFDIDFGANFDAQYLFAVQDPALANRAGEHDSGNGDLGGEGSTPVARPNLYNVTYIGSGTDPANAADGNDLTLKLRDNWGGTYRNSIFTSFPQKAVEFENLDSGPDSYQQFQDGYLQVEGNIFHGYGAGSTFADIVANQGTANDEIATYLENNNEMVDPQLGGVTVNRDSPGGIDPVPASDSPAASGAVDVPSEDRDFVEAVNYRGAFEPGGENWAAGWTALSQAGYFD